MSSNNNNKPWERPWTTEEITENASNWNLGADVGLLKHLEQFSEDLLKKANTTNSNLNNLLENLTNALLSLDIARNEFMSLSNTQFIESRVYEDDETLPVENEKDNSSDEKKQREEDDRIKDMKLAVMTGLEVLDKYFDKIEVPASDSEDETDCPSFVLRPKDPYLDRPLPYVIGSDEWHKTWHVGLAESSSDSETEKISEKFSDTDSESDLPVVNRQAKSVSESGSEADLSNRIQGNGPVANSTFNDTNRHFFGSSGSEEFNSVSAQAPISQNNFAEQLAAKLGNVIARSAEVPEPEINKRPIQKASGVGDFGNLFSNEPPPLDDSDDLFGGKPSQHGVFSGGDGLFDDLDNDVSFWGQKKDVAKRPPLENQKPHESLSVPAQEKAVPNLFDDEEEEEGDAIFGSVVRPQAKQEAGREGEKKIDEKKPGGLFDDGDASDDDDDDIFNSDKLKKKLEFFAQQRQRQPPAQSLLDEEPPSLIADGEKGKKVPVGGVSVLAHDEMKKALKHRQYSSESSDSGKEKHETNDSGKSPETKPDVNEVASPKKKTTDLFDQDDELFDDLFIDVPQKKFSSGLFDGADDFAPAQKDSHSLFEDLVEDDDAPPHRKRKEGRRKSDKAKAISLFDEDDDGFDDDFLSASPKKAPAKANDGVGDTFSPKEAETESRQTNSIASAGDDGGKLESNEENVNKTRQTLSLFDDDEGVEEDDLFLIAPKTTKRKSDNIFRDVSLGSDDDLFKGTGPKSAEIKADVSSDEAAKTSEQSKTTSGSPFEDTPKNLPVNVEHDSLIFDESSSKNPKQETEVEGRQEEEDEGLFSSTQPPENELFGSVVPPVIQIESSQGANINLFDPTPPTDLDNWDTHSENILFDDDIYSFDNGGPSASEQRSSIFDAEPPSLLCNESSGIVRDQSARNETDESSFFPYASSSRRLSTDLSHEDDSIFITKTRNAIESNFLHDIPEASSQTSGDSLTSAVDLTPSGNVDDLYSEVTTFANDESESLSQEKNVSVAEGAKDGGESKEKLEKKPPVPKAKPQVQGHKSTAEAKEGGPGKLKHSLNINVRALLPGAAAPSRRNLEKSKSLDLSQESERKNDAEDLGVASGDLLKNSKSNEASHSESNLYDPEGSVEVLQSVTKDRVRIPIRRRPSTKKGREALRKSCIDFSALERAAEPGEEERGAPKSFPTETGEKLTGDGVHRRIDVADGKAKIMDDVPSKSDQPKTSAAEEAARSASKNLLSPNFSGERRTSFVKSDNFESPDFKKSDLFDDEDNGDDIFSAKKLPPKSDMFKRSSLFEDDDDDDAEDIFGTSAAITAKASGDVRSGTSRRPKSSILKKLENTEVIFDPLDALKK